MIIIDEGATQKLAATLELLRAEPDNSRCIYFHLMNKPAIFDIKNKIIESAKHHIGGIDTKIFLCDDADICIIAPFIPSKDGKALILEIANYTNMPADESWVGFYDVALKAHKLIDIVQQKIERKRKAEEYKRIQQEQQLKEYKRQSILNIGQADKANDIKIRRENRSTPELMMIEDDAFSRKLVENVLQKQYHLTALAEATHALETYIRLAPDVLFLDINLPDVTGHELLERILAIDPNAYVIMLSGNADQHNILHAMNRGAKGFIAKPFNREKLFQYIERCPTIKTPPIH